MSEGFEVDMEFTHFLHSKLPPEQRKEWHDEILVKLTDDVNNLLKEAQKQKRNKRLGMMITPQGFFFCWMENYHLKDKTGAIPLTEDNMEEMFGLTR